MSSQLERIDVFGSKRVDREQLLARWGADLVEMIGIARTPAFSSAKRALEERMRDEGPFAFVDVAVVTYFQPRTVYVTVDLLDPEDAGRLHFNSPPSEERGDPDGLISLWQEYQDKALALLMDGVIEVGPEACPAWHCITFAHVSLVSYRDAFVARVGAAEDELAGVLASHRNAASRGAAAFLLAHLASGERVVHHMLSAVLDPSLLVRNNALRVLASIANDHPTIEIPLAPIIDALHFPTTTDRNKAAAVLAGIVGSDPRSHQTVIDDAGNVLVAMLALRQPNNHSYAYAILKAISGCDLGERDVDAWHAWLNMRDRPRNER